MPPGNPLLDWIALHLLPGIGPALVRRAVGRFGDPGTVAHRVPVRSLEELGLRAVHAVAIEELRPGLRRRAEEELAACDRLGIRILLATEPDYPAALGELPDAPPLLYVKGELPPGVVRVAMVGSRRATAYGRRAAAGLAAALADRGVEIVSGGARGIDTAAHTGTLEAGGRTIAVLGSGLRHPYPPENQELFERIAGSGALVSEFPLDYGPKPENFPRRNRLVSGLSAAVVVVEAAPKSGSFITVGHALEQGREVLAVPGPVTSEQSTGCHRLIQQGAKLVHEVADVLEELPPPYAGAVRSLGGPGPSVPGPDLAGLSGDEVAVLTLLDDPEPVHLDDLALRAPFGVGRLMAALFGLEVRGAVEQLPGRYYLGRPRDPHPARVTEDGS